MRKTYRWEDNVHFCGILYLRISVRLDDKELYCLHIPVAEGETIEEVEKFYREMSDANRAEQLLIKNRVSAFYL